MKISVLMPTFNDAKYISKAIESVLSQKEIDVELIVVDDCSKDETDEIVNSYQTNRIKYIKHQENKGQLNALLTGIRNITGDFVCMFHSDDLLFDEYCLKRNIEFIRRNSLDGCYGDIVVMGEKGEKTSIRKVEKELGKNSLIKLLLLGGSNIIGDPFFVRKEVFLNYIVKTYILWNMPYWFYEEDDQIKILNLGYTRTPWYKYRVYSENYMGSKIGQFEVFNGIVRTILVLSKYINVNNPKLPYRIYFPTWLFGVFKKLDKKYYKKQVYMFLRKVISRINVNSEGLHGKYYKAVISSYSKKSNIKEYLGAKDIEKTKIFIGKDARLFAKRLEEDNVDNLYKFLIDIGSEGEFKLVIPRKYEKIVRQIRKFLNINFQIESVE